MLIEALAAVAAVAVLATSAFTSAREARFASPLGASERARVQAGRGSAASRSDGPVHRPDEVSRGERGRRTGARRGCPQRTSTGRGSERNPRRPPGRRYRGGLMGACQAQVLRGAADHPLAADPRGDERIAALCESRTASSASRPRFAAPSAASRLLPSSPSSGPGWSPPRVDGRAAPTSLAPSAKACCAGTRRPSCSKVAGPISTMTRSGAPCGQSLSGVANRQRSQWLTSCAAVPPPPRALSAARAQAAWERDARNRRRCAPPAPS